MCFRPDQLRRVAVLCHVHVTAWSKRVAPKSVLSLKLSLFIPRRAEVARRLADRAQPLLK